MCLDGSTTCFCRHSCFWRCFVACLWPWLWCRKRTTTEGSLSVVFFLFGVVPIVSFYCYFVLHIPLDWSLHALYYHRWALPLCRQIGGCWPEVPVFGSLVFLCFCARPFFVFFAFYSSIIVLYYVCALWLLEHCYLGCFWRVFQAWLFAWWCGVERVPLEGVWARFFLFLVFHIVLILLLWVVHIVRLMIERVVAMAL